MSNRLKVMIMVSIMAVAVSVITVVVILLEPCQYCGSKFCNGDCVIIYNNENRFFDKTDTLEKKNKTNQKTTRILETEMADDNYLDSLVFIGDSRTIGLKAFANLSDDNVFAEDGLNHEAALTKEIVPIQEFKNVTIVDAVKLRAPDIMVVSLGINGAVWLSVDNFMEGYSEFIKEMESASPSSVIVISAITPVAMFYENKEDGVSNEKIDEINLALYEYAKNNGYYYLALDENLKDENNDLPDEYHNGDGLHYNKKAYEVIVDYLNTHQIYKKRGIL
ncbi:MAG: SGNH/GDSL hydrolase family protein [Oscillospiraceae bacterium]